MYSFRLKGHNCEKLSSVRSQSGLGKLMKVTTTERKCIKTFSSSVCVSVCVCSAGYAYKSRWAFCMTDGLVKHEGVVSINDVPPHPSDATDRNMCTFLSVILCAYHTQTCTNCPSYPLTVPVLYKHRNTHTDLLVYAKPDAVHSAPPTHCTALQGSRCLLLTVCGTILNLVQQSMKVLSFPRVGCSYAFSIE